MNALLLPISLGQPTMTCLTSVTQVGFFMRYDHHTKEAAAWSMIDCPTQNSWVISYQLLSIWGSAYFEKPVCFFILTPLPNPFGFSNLRFVTYNRSTARAHGHRHLISLTDHQQYLVVASTYIETLLYTYICVVDSFQQKPDWTAVVSSQSLTPNPGKFSVFVIFWSSHYIGRKTCALTGPRYKINIAMILNDTHSIFFIENSSLAMMICARSYIHTVFRCNLKTALYVFFR